MVTIHVDILTNTDNNYFVTEPEIASRLRLLNKYYMAEPLLLGVGIYPGFEGSCGVQYTSLKTNYIL